MKAASLIALEREGSPGVAFADVEDLPESDEGVPSAIDERGLFFPTPSGDGAMARIRVPAGELQAKQLRDIASIVDELTTGYVQITTRGNFQIRVIRPENTETVLQRLRATGLHPEGPGADNPRNITANPISGIDPLELIDTVPFCQELARRLTSDSAYQDIPGKFNVAIDSGGRASVMEDSNDLGARAVVVDGEVRFRIALGGAGEEHDLGVVVRPEDLVETLLAVVRVHNRLRNREVRLRARLKCLLQEWTMEGLLEEIEGELSDVIPKPVRLSDNRTEGALAVCSAHPQAGVFPQKQPDLHYIGVAIPVGQISVLQMRLLVDLAETFGCGALRLTVWQNVILPGIPTAHLESVKDRLVEAGLHWRQSNLRSGIIACTGNTYCEYSLSDTKAHAVELADYLDERLRLDLPINIHFTGCAFSCAQHDVGDIGLLAARSAEVGEAYHVFLGGGFGRQRSLGRKVSPVPLSLSQIKPAILRILQAYLEERGSGESFQHFSSRRSRSAFEELLTSDCISQYGK